MRDINFLDAQQALGFIIPQMLRIETEAYQTKYPSYDYSKLMFVNTDGDMWDIGSVFFSGDIAGAAGYISGKGFDMPYADISQSQFLQTNNLAGIGYEWSLQDLQRAAKLGRNLGADKAAAARKVAEQFIYSIAVAGSTEKGTTGFTNDANVPTATLPADGTGSATTLSSKTATQVLRDVNAVLNAPFNATLETHIANTLALPTSIAQYLAITPVSTSDLNYTLLAYIKEFNFYTLTTSQPLNIVVTRALETAGSGGTKRLVGYDNGKDVLQFHLPGPHEFLPAFQKSSMTWEVAGIMNIGGVEVRIPKAMAFRDGA